MTYDEEERTLQPPKLGSRSDKDVDASNVCGRSSRHWSR